MSGAAFNKKKPRAKIRSSSGMLALTLGVTVLLIAIGLSICGLIGFLAGFRELQNATDSAALSVGKEQMKSTVTLNPGLEKDNFSAVVDEGKVNLLNYNRIVGQLILVSLNAESERSQGSTGALSHANQLWMAVQGGNASISERLSDRLKDSSSASTPFSGMIGMSNLKFLPSQGLGYCDRRYNVAYFNEGESTNVFLDDSQIPKGAQFSSDCLSSPKGKLGHRFFRGYKAINVADSFIIEGTPVMPGRSPHLVSSGTFAKHLAQPLAAGAVPPNCFQSACQLKGKNARVSFDACAVVGSLQTEYPASIPGGYVEVDNAGNSSHTLMELIDNAGIHATEKVVPQLVQRLRQIQPALSDDGAADYLNNVRVGSGKRVFLCLSAESQQLIVSPALPSTYVSGTIADGTDQILGQSLTYTPSSGYNNLLAVMKVTKPAESKAELAESAEERAAQRLLEIEKERLASDMKKAAVDALKAELALDRAASAEERIKSDMAQAQDQEQKAAAAAQKAAADEHSAQKALQQARSDAEHAHSNKDKAAALDHAATAMKQEAKASEQRASQQKVLADLANQRALSDTRLAQAERQRMEKDLQLAQLARARESFDGRLGHMSDRKSDKPLVDGDHTSKSVVAHGLRIVPSANQPDSTSNVSNQIQQNNLSISNQSRVNTDGNDNDDKTASSDAGSLPKIQTYKW